MVTDAAFRKLALSLPEAVEKGHMGHPDFRVRNKIFATLQPDKHLAVMPGVSHASFQQRNYELVYHILASFLGQPEPLYRG